MHASPSVLMEPAVEAAVATEPTTPPDHAEVLDVDAEPDDETPAAPLNPVEAILQAQSSAATTLRLSHGALTVEGARTLARALSSSACSFVAVQLESMAIEAPEVAELAESLRGCKTLTSLDLSFNPRVGTGVAALMDALGTGSATADEGTSVTSLNLFTTGVRDAGATAIARALTAFRCRLTSLDLGGNGITDAGARALAKALDDKTAPVGVVRLDLSLNLIGDSGCMAIASALMEHKTLADLRLQCNYIGTAGARRLGSCLKANRALTALNLYHNDLGVDGVRELAAAFVDGGNTTLSTLVLSATQPGELGGVAIAAILFDNSSLTRLDMSGQANGCGIGSIGARKLAAALRRNAALTNLNVEGNGIGDAGVRAIAKALREENRTMKALGIEHGNNIDDPAVAEEARLARVECMVYGRKLLPWRGGRRNRE